jgi:hypothetical protein
LQQYLQAALQVQPLMQGNIPVNLEVADLQVQPGVVRLIYPEENSCQDDDAYQPIDVPLAHVYPCSPRICLPLPGKQTGL